MNSITHDCLVAFFFASGLIAGYGIIMWWINWFYKNYKIIKRNEGKNDK